MAPWMNIAVATSLVLSLVLAVVRAFKTKNFRALVFEISVVLIVALFLKYLFGFPVPSGTVAKSSSSDKAVASALFVCMALGMVAQFLYSHFSTPKSARREFDWGLFVAPLFTSPIVFIPLLAALQNADIDLANLTAPRLMVFLVAFQNGFFWKDFFDKQRREARGR